MTRRGSKLCWHSYRNGPIYKVHRICQHAIELWLVVLCAVGAQPDDTNWIWNIILFSVWALRWKPANTAQMKAVVSCLKYISYRLIPLGWKNFAADTILWWWWWNCQRDCLYCLPLSWLRKTCRIIYSSDWILPTRKRCTLFHSNLYSRHFKKEKNQPKSSWVLCWRPYFIPFNWRIKKFIKRKNWKSFVLSPHLKPPFF